jgi:hypothetical protein
VKLGALALLCALAAPAATEPCAEFVPTPFVMGDALATSSEGGIVVGELPRQAGTTPPSDRTTWSLRVNGKRIAPTVDVIAPGLVVYRPPATGAMWSLVDAKATSLGTFRRAQKLPDLVDAPAVARVVSGSSGGRHPNSFVNVELSSPAPKDVIALVLSKAKARAYSWGTAGPNLSAVIVFSSGSGCFPVTNGATQATPGESVTLFWVDKYGRRSRVTPAIVVEKL